MKPPLHLAKEQDLRTLGLQPAAAADRKEKLVAQLGQLRRSMRSLSLMLESCTKCGNCAQQCHSYLGTGDAVNIPAAAPTCCGRFTNGISRSPANCWGVSSAPPTLTTRRSTNG